MYWRSGRASVVTPRRAHLAVPLSVSTTNARYLADRYGNPVYLSGFHTWYSVQDGGYDDPPAATDWDEFVTALQSYGCNLTKLWCHETPRGWSDVTDHWFTPTRYTRTGPGNDADGKLKFDLDQINPDYINRLATRAQSLEAAGIYYIVQMFQGWQIESKGYAGDPATYHPYNSTNNINSIDGDQNNDGELTETHLDTVANVVLAYQQAMVEAIIDATNGLPHLVAYEISNEDTGSTDNTNWQYDMVDYVINYQLGKSCQHLVMMTKQFPNESDTTLDGSNAHVVSYGLTKGDAVHSASDPVSIYDTDHTDGLIAENDIDWIWTSFCEGHGGSLFMDQWDGALYSTDWRNMAGYVVVRENCGYAVTLANMLNNLLLMTPQAALSTSGFCLARDHATAAEYVCFYSGSSTFNLNLTTATGTLNIRWLRCSDGTVTDNTTTTGGATRTLTPPWTGQVVAYVRH